MLRINDTIQDISGQRLADIISTLPQWRQEVVMRYKFEGNRRESALAFRLLQEMLRDTGLMDEGSIKNIQFAIGEHGKPAIADHDNIFFNISHCKYAVACVVSDKPCGVDVECIGRYSDGVARYTLSEEELHILYYDEEGERRTDDDMQLQFTIFWTKKEALLKLLGTGITDDIKNILHIYDGRIIFNTTINKEKKYVCTEAAYRQSLIHLL